ADTEYKRFCWGLGTPYTLWTMSAWSSSSIRNITLFWILRGADVTISVALWPLLQNALFQVAFSGGNPRGALTTTSTLDAWMSEIAAGTDCEPLPPPCARSRRRSATPECLPGRPPRWSRSAPFACSSTPPVGGPHRPPMLPG